MSRLFSRGLRSGLLQAANSRRPQCAAALGCSVRSFAQNHVCASPASDSSLKADNQRGTGPPPPYGPVGVAAALQADPLSRMSTRLRQSLPRLDQLTVA